MPHGYLSDDAERWEQDRAVALEAAEDARAASRTPLAETDPRLIALLRRAGDEWGPTGVARAAAAIVKEAQHDHRG